MTVLITGGCGFIGTNFIIDWFKTTNEPIINLDCLTYASNDHLIKNPTYKNLTNIKINIGDEIGVKDALNTFKPRAIIHFAAESHVDRSIASADDFIRTNINGTYNLLVSALRYYEKNGHLLEKSFNFIHVSTDEVFGSLGPDERGFSETSPYRPNSPYSASKAASDHLARCYYETFSLPTIVTNCSNNYGPYQNVEKLIPTVISCFLAGKKIPVYGDGKQIRDWLYVADHCEALRRILDCGVAGQSYNIGGDCEMTNLDLISSIYDELVSTQPELVHAPMDNFISHVADRLGHDRRYSIDANKMKKDLGWKAAHQFKDGIAKTVQWYLRSLGFGS